MPHAGDVSFVSGSFCLVTVSVAAAGANHQLSVPSNVCRVMVQVYGKI